MGFEDIPPSSYSLVLHYDTQISRKGHLYSNNLKSCYDKQICDLKKKKMYSPLKLRESQEIGGRFGRRLRI